MHGQHAVHHDHGRTRDGDLIGQAFDLPVELVKREPSAEVQSGKARLDIGPEGLKHGNEATGVNPACTVHPVHHVSLGQCVGPSVQRRIACSFLHVLVRSGGRAAQVAVGRA